MRRPVIAAFLLVLLSACVDGGAQMARTPNSSGGTTLGTVVPRSGGGYAVNFTALGNDCTAVYDSAVPGGTEISPVVCSADGSGNATMVYAADGSPDRVTFGGLGIGSGTLVF